VQGVERIHSALSAHMWPGLTLKSEPNLNSNFNRFEGLLQSFSAVLGTTLFFTLDLFHHQLFDVFFSSFSLFIFYSVFFQPFCYLNRWHIHRVTIILIFNNMIMIIIIIIIIATTTATIVIIIIIILFYACDFFLIRSSYLFSLPARNRRWCDRE
jgi:hypothetical protein